MTSGGWIVSRRVPSSAAWGVACYGNLPCGKMG
eukprot:SAG25_NODE_5485_length_653_cov_1.155235_2_plen_32_part_01